MSTENENQNISPPSTTTAISSKEKIIINCTTCEGIIDDNNTKLICKNKQCGSIICDRCINLMFDVMFAQPDLNYPFKCGECQYSFQLEDIDQILIKQKRYEQFIACVLPLYWSNDCLNKNEKLAQCPFCPYVEIHTTDTCPLYFMTCKHPLCNQRSCLICLHSITDDNDELKHRSNCIEYYSYKQMIDKAIETGSKQHCPHCQLTGLKDDGCTHMICERCGLSWCYLCGMKEEECLVDDDSEQSLSAHNQDWDQHEGRCPMSLISIHELDERWPEDDRDCLEYFHRYRTLCQLYDVFKIIGEDTFDKINENYGLINSSGYTIEEIKDYQNRILIDYSGKTDE